MNQVLDSIQVLVPLMPLGMQTPGLTTHALG